MWVEQSATSTSHIGVPQGSSLSPLRFTLYVATLAKVTEYFGAQHHQYADDTYLYILASRELTTGTQTFDRCADALYNWLSHIGLAINPSKSKVIQFSISQARYTKNVATINFAGAPITLSPSVKSLGVTLDSHLTLDDHVTAVSKACYFHIRALRRIRASIPDNVENMIACSHVGSHLDYCNSLLAGMSEANFAMLQCVQIPQPAS